MLLAPNVADHSYHDSVYLKIFTALSFLANLRLLSFANVHRRRKVKNIGGGGGGGGGQGLEYWGGGGGGANSHQAHDVVLTSCAH